MEYTHTTQLFWQNKLGRLVLSHHLHGCGATQDSSLGLIAVIDAYPRFYLLRIPQIDSSCKMGVSLFAISLRAQAQCVVALCMQGAARMHDDG